MWFSALVELKKKSGKTLKQISEESKVPLGTLNKLFSGQTKDPKLETVQAVVHALGYTLDDLDDGQSTKNSPSTAEAAPGEEDIELMNYLKRGIYDMGFLPEGADLTDRQLEALLGVCAILHAIFGE